MDIEQKIKNIFDALKSERLSERERFVMRSELQLLMKKHPVRPPFYIQLIDHWYAPGALGSTFVGRHVFATAFALVLIVGAGSSYAAEGALPGEALYPLKVHFNEQMVGVLAVSSEDKIDWSAQLSERRLEEAEALAASGTLTVEKSEKIAAYFDKANLDFENHISVVASSQAEEDAFADASAMHEVSLAAHANVLEKISKRLPETSEALKPIVTKVRDRVIAGRARGTDTLSVSATMMMQADAAPEAKKGNDNREVEKARTQKERAKKRVEEVRVLAEKSKGELGTTTYRYLSEEASSTLTIIESADSAVERGDYGSAIETYTNVIQVAVEAKAGLNAQIRLEQSIKTSGKSSNVRIINGEDREDEDD